MEAKAYNRGLAPLINSLKTATYWDRRLLTLGGTKKIKNKHHILQVLDTVEHILVGVAMVHYHTQWNHRPWILSHYLLEDVFTLWVLPGLHSYMPEERKQATDEGATKNQEDFWV